MVIMATDTFIYENATNDSAFTRLSIIKSEDI